MSAGRMRTKGAFAALVVIAGCAATEAPPAASSAPAPPVADREPWARFDEIASFSALNDVPFPTRGHLVKPSHAVVRASPEARADYLALVTDTVLPSGATIALFHESSDGTEKGPVYVMEKHDAAWAFLALDANGRVTSDNVDVCALCHRGGVADQLFGLPRGVTPKAR
ncbi:MAG TPA: hypothetical protein VFZ53_23330 [Polyangiaceae bacterium]